MSRRVCVMGCRRPTRPRRPGSETSNDSASRLSRAACSTGVFALLKGGLELGAQGVGGGADLRSLLGRQLVQAAQDLRDGALAAEVAQPPRVQGLVHQPRRRVRRGHGSLRASRSINERSCMPAARAGLLLAGEARGVRADGRM